MSQERAPQMPSQMPADRSGESTGPENEGPYAHKRKCIAYSSTRAQQRTHFHGELQDTSAPGWIRLLELIGEAAADGREVFKPLIELTREQRRQIVTLPPSIADLTAVRHLNLYRSNLVRIPPEIGAMRSLEAFTPYTSPRLHWFPYEITRCPELTRSTVSTRVLYGNFKYRPPFPQLRAAPSAADHVDLGPPFPAADLHQVWISLHVSGHDVMPLLVNACSQACIDALPKPPRNYIRAPHTGGPAAVQPPAED